MLPNGSIVCLHERRRRRDGSLPTVAESVQQRVQPLFNGYRHLPVVFHGRGFKSCSRYCGIFADKSSKIFVVNFTFFKQQFSRKCLHPSVVAQLTAPSLSLQGTRVRIQSLATLIEKIYCKLFVYRRKIKKNRPRMVHLNKFKLLRDIFLPFRSFFSGKTF